MASPGSFATALAPLIGEAIVRKLGFRPLFGWRGLALVATGFVWRCRADARRVAALNRLVLERGGLDELRHRHMAVTPVLGSAAGTMFVSCRRFADSLGVETSRSSPPRSRSPRSGVRVFGGR